MRLLKVKVDGAELFKNCLFELDFIATDRVPRDDEQLRRGRPLIGHDQPGCNASERALTTAVVADDARPALRKRNAHAIERRRRSTFIGIRDI